MLSHSLEGALRFARDRSPRGTEACRDGVLRSMGPPEGGGRRVTPGKGSPSRDLRALWGRPSRPSGALSHGTGYFVGPNTRETH